MDLHNTHYICTIAILGVCWMVTSSAGDTHDVETSATTTIERQGLLPLQENVRTLLTTSSSSNAVAESLASEWFRFEVAMLNMIVNECPSDAWARVPDKVAARFIGFAEAKLGVVAPTHWRKCVGQAEILRNSHLRFPIQVHSPWRDRLRSDGDVFPPALPAVNLIRDGNQVFLDVKTGDFPSTGRDGNMRLADAFLAAIQRGDLGPHDLISSALFYGNQLFVAVSSDQEPGGKLYCLSSNGETAWTFEMANCGGTEYKGSGEWYTELRVGTDGLILFHCCETGIAIQGVGLDGKPSYLFSTQVMADELRNAQ